MENQLNNQLVPQAQQKTPQTTKWHKGVIAIITLGILTVLVSWLYFAKQNKQNGVLQPTASHKDNLAEKIGEYIIPVDFSVKRLSFSVVFKPTNRDKTYDLLNKTGGQNFYLQSSEISKFASIETATRGENLLIVNGKFDNNSAQKIIITTPSGKTLTEDASSMLTAWSAGEVATIKNPETGNWKLRITGSGEFSVRATADTDIAIISWDFVKLGGRPGHEGYFPIEKEPAIGADQILKITIAENTNKTEMPTFHIISGQGSITASAKFYTASRDYGFGDFYGVIKIPKEDFRIMVKGKDEKNFSYQRTFSMSIHPEEKTAPLTKNEIDDFIRTSEQTELITTNITKSQLSEIHDEPLLTSSGKPIGIKLTYRIQFPKNMPISEGYPEIYSTEFGNRPAYMTAQNKIINPPLVSDGYQRDTDYQVTIDYRPDFIRDDGASKSLCAWKEGADSFLQNDSKAKFMVVIQDANYNGITEKEYSPREFYDNAIKEGAKNCVY